MTTPANKLATELSPYLLQHADNPVHWVAWSADALARAQRENKPIILSIGYAACHWCHVMAHESFEDDATAAYMNEHFINIKVDREERPDIDALYMAALQALGEQGGWPLTMFLTPKGEPFYGGTYYPKEALYGQPSFQMVLKAIKRTFDGAPEKIAQNQQALTEHLRTLSRNASNPDPSSMPGTILGWELVDAASRRLLELCDPDHGGLKGAPKFPNCSVLTLIYLRGLQWQDEGALSAFDLALTQMCQGGIYDHLGGGFARYTVDAIWLVPHFEKMLYDNAQLIDLLSLSVARTQNPLHAARLEETIDWLIRDMAQPDGGFSASLDADSDGEEGRFYIWKETEIDAVLGDESALFKRVYDVTPGGNWESSTILNRLGQQTLVESAAERRLDHARARLLHYRNRRVPPALDDKILADWNGLLITALAKAGARLHRSDWIALAQHHFEQLLTKMQDETGRLAHAARGHRQTRPGFASDHAQMAQAALALFEATGEPEALSAACSLMDILAKDYCAEDGGLFMSATAADDMLVRPRAQTDDAVPSAAGVAADVWVRLWIITGEDSFRERADRLFAALKNTMIQNAFASASLITALALRMNAIQAILVGSPAAPDLYPHPCPQICPLKQALYATGHPHIVVQQVARETTLPPDHPAYNKVVALPADPEPTLFLCIGTTCSLPITEPAEITSTLTTLRQTAC